MIVLLAVLIASVSGKTYERCELARELRYSFEVPQEEVPVWVCIAEHESQYNTSAVGTRNADESSDHGIFQINDEYWCSPPGKGWACGLTCAQLEDDDIEDDFECAKRIHKEHKFLSGDGFSAWAVYEPFCKGSRVEKYVEGCFNETDESVTPPPKKKPTTKKVYPWLLPRPSSTPPPDRSATEVTSPAKGSSVCFNRVDASSDKPKLPATSGFVPGSVSTASLLPSSAITRDLPRFTSVTPSSSTVGFPTSSIVSSNFPRFGAVTTRVFTTLGSTQPRTSFASSTPTILAFPRSNRFTSGVTHFVPEISKEMSNNQKRESAFIVNGRVWV